MRALAVAFWVTAVLTAALTLVVAYDTAHRPDTAPVCYGKAC